MAKSKKSESAFWPVAGWLYLAFCVFLLIAFRLKLESQPQVLALYSIPAPIFLILPLVVALAKFRKWRRNIGWILSIVVFGAFGTGFTLGSPTPGTTQDIRVVTWNIRHGEFGIKRLVEALKSQEPDVIILQECESPTLERRDWIAALANQFPQMDYRYATSQTILSRFPIERAKKIDVPTRFPGTKAFLELEIKTPKGIVRVMNVHLEPTWRMSIPNFNTGFQGMMKVGRWKTAQLELLEKHVRNAQGPMILAGDFNMGPVGRTYHAWEGFRDAFAATSTGFGYTSAAVFPLRRLDYIWARKLKPLRSWTFGGSASDHLGVCADLLIE